MNGEIASGVKRKIRIENGYWCAEDRRDRLRPIRLAAVPVTNFAPGWFPQVLLDFGLSIYLLEFRDKSGRGATWFVNENYDHITDNVHRLKPEQRNDLMRILSNSIREVYQKLLSGTDAPIACRISSIGMICEETMREFVGLFLASELPSCPLVQINTLGKDESAITLDNKSITLKHLVRLFDVNLQHKIDAAIRQGFLMCCSPVNGVELRSSQSLIIHDHRMAFRFVEPAHDFVFYIGTTHHIFCVADLYIPAFNIAFFNMSDDARIPAANLVSEYLTHFVKYNQEIRDYLNIVERVPVVLFRGFPGMHIGHQLWNELTAYDRLSRNGGSDVLPIIVVPNAEHGTEAYGPIDQLFPEWSGKIDRTLHTEIEALPAFIYRNKYFAVRALDNYVTTSLSHRITQTASATSHTSQSRTQITSLKVDGYQFITIGVRVENRTSIDIYDLLEKAIIYLFCKVSKLVVIIDGHNSRVNNDPTLTFNSFGQSEDTNPVLIELELVIKLRHRFEGTGIEIINTIGKSVQESIVWIEGSRCFIAIWGAGLAKYRWVCNCIGLVLTSQENLTNRADLHIYSNGEFQENPTPMIFVNPDVVSDCSTAPVMFSPPNSSPNGYYNFRVNFDRLVPQLEHLLQISSFLGSNFDEKRVDPHVDLAGTA